nr:MAG: DNA binding protein [Microviridae sp.]
MQRHKVNKYHSARKFNKATGRTKGANIQPPPMRGGFRL